MRRARVNVWKRGEETMPLLTKCLDSACPRLFLANEIYASMDMKTGIDPKALAEWSGFLLKPLIALDPRGGFFSQCDIHEAVKAQADLEANKPHAEKAAMERKLSLAGLFVYIEDGIIFLLIVCGRAMPDLS
jgi:hypothetical protein